MGRKRRKGGKRKGLYRYSDKVPINEQLKQKLKDAKDDMASDDKQNRTIDESEGHRTAKDVNRTDESCNLYIGNLPYECSADSLVRQLVDHISIFQHVDMHEPSSFPITECRMPHVPVWGKSYFAFITVASHHARDVLLEARICLGNHSRKLNIKTTKRSVRPGRDKAGLQMVIPKLMVGFPVLEHLSPSRRDQYHRFVGQKAERQCWRSQWENSGNVNLDVNGVERVICFEFTAHNHTRDDVPRIRLECLMKYVKGNIHLEKDTKGRFILSLTLMHPPKVFRYEGLRQQLPEDEIIMFSYPVIHQGIKNEYDWSLGHLAAEDDKMWTRTVDQFSNGVIGRCLLYRIALDDHTTASKLVNFLHRFGLVNRRFDPHGQYQNVELLSLDNTNVMPGWSGDWSTDKLFEPLDFQTKYAIHTLVYEGRIDFVSNIHATLDFIAYIQVNERRARAALEAMAIEKTFVFYFDPVKALLAFQKSIDDGNDEDDDESGISDTDGAAMIRRVSITPLRIVARAPELSNSNRVLRHYRSMAHRFARVHFTDETFGSFLQAKSPDTLKHQVSLALNDGVILGGRRFSFLAYSNSQLREHSCWFYDEEPDDQDGKPPSAESIRKWMGNLDQVRKIPGLHGARLGQCFSDSVDAVMLSDEQWRMIPDVERNKYCFSDGCGMMSKAISEEIAKRMNLRESPSVVQIRFGGCKGVLSVMPSILNFDHVDVMIRPSMKKFESSHRQLEVVNVAKYMPAYLNRQLIVLLSALGIEDNVFLKLQRHVINILDEILFQSNVAKAFTSQVDSAHRDTALRAAYDMLSVGFEPTNEPFLKGILRSLRAQQHINIAGRSRILIEKGVTAIGIMDETGTLEDGTVFVQFQSRAMKEPVVLTHDRVLVGRCPSLHPGDLRVLKCVDIPALRHLVNVVVFPSKGERPLPTQMSGGDLDGDIYFCSWDPSLIPAYMFEPMNGDSIGKKANPASNVSIQDIKNWFVHAIENDNLGFIANAFMVHADVQENGALSMQCLELAELHSIAVDFAKTGIPAELPEDLRPPRVYPDFMQNTQRPSYMSLNILGVMYREARGYTFTEPGRSSIAFDKDLRMPETSQFLDEAYALRDDYNTELWHLMCQFGVPDEAEMCSGYVHSFTLRDAQRPRNPEDVVERMRMALRKIQQAFREEFWQGLDDFVEDMVWTGNKEERKWWAWTKAAAWYECVYGEVSGHFPESDHFFSFAWIMYDLLCEIKLHAKEPQE